MRGNSDTEYKKKLFELLEKYANNNNVNIGTVETASENETNMVFEILMEADWQQKLNRRLSL